MRKIAVLTVVSLLLLGVGCSLTPKKGRAHSRPPHVIDWQDPASVVQGFFSAKRWADWQKAYSCCDYEETLPKEERARIKKAWKAECDRWPIEYANTIWNITGRGRRGDVAVVRIQVMRRDPITRELKEGEVYEEELKLYEGKWKITNPCAPEPST